jgi:hypothetical protein
MGKEYNVIGVTGGIFGDTEVASRRRGGTGHTMKEFVDHPLQVQTSGEGLIVYCDPLTLTMRCDICPSRSQFLGTTSGQYRLSLSPRHINDQIPILVETCPYGLQVNVQLRKGDVPFIMTCKFTVYSGQKKT